METAKQRTSRLYYEANKQKISEKRKQWYVQNRATALTRVKAYQQRKKAVDPEPEPEPEPSSNIKVDGPIKVCFK